MSARSTRSSSRPPEGTEPCGTARRCAISPPPRPSGAEMLTTIGVGDVEALIERIPSKARLDRELAIPAAMAESDLVAHLRGLAERNADADRYVSFLGGGAYDHFVPSAVDHLLAPRRVLHRLHALPARGQPGHARSDLRVPDDDLRADRHGRLQRLPLRRRLGAGRGGAHGAQRHGAATRSSSSGSVIPLAPASRGDLLRGTPTAGRRACRGPTASRDLDALRRRSTDKTAAVMVQYPNFFGCLEDLDRPPRSPTAGRAARRRASTRSRSGCSGRRASPAPTSSSARARGSATP